VTPPVADAWRAILLRRPRWRLEREVHAETRTPDWPPELLAELGPADPGRVALDLTGIDARPGAGKPPSLAIERRDGGPGPSLDEALARVPAWSLIGRRYRRMS
jgi:hypothetical protein